jgi:hypothetical protein
MIPVSRERETFTTERGEDAMATVVNIDKCRRHSHDPEKGRADAAIASAHETYQNYENRSTAEQDPGGEVDMSGQLVGKFPNKKLSDPVLKFILVMIAERCHGDNPESFPGIRWLHQATEYDERTIKRKLKKAIELGFVVTGEQNRGGRGNVASWRLDFDKMPDCIVNGRRRKVGQGVTETVAVSPAKWGRESRKGGHSVQRNNDGTGLNQKTEPEGTIASLSGVLNKATIGIPKQTDQNKQPSDAEWIADLLPRVFAWFVHEAGRNPSTYVLTPAWGKMFEQRVQELLASGGRGWAKRQIKNALVAAMEDDWRYKNGRDHWDDVFGTREKFAKMIDLRETQKWAEENENTARVAQL